MASESTLPNAGEPRPIPTEPEKEWAMYCHMSGIPGLLLVFLSFGGPLACWMSRKDTSKYIDYHGKEALNFQINIAIYAVFALICAMIAKWMVLVLVGVLIYGGVMAVLAGQRAKAGDLYQYPGNVRLV